MKKIKSISTLLIGVLICLLISACGSSKSENSTEYKGLKVYPVKITSMKSDPDNGGIIIKGKTDAPKGAKVLAQSTIEDNKDDNEASSANDDNYGYEKVKKGRFAIYIDNALDLISGDTIKKGQKLKIKVFAVTGYKVKYNDYSINSKLRKAIKKAKIKPVTYMADVKLVDYYKDDNSDSDNDDQDSNDNDDEEDSNDDSDNYKDDNDSSSSEKSKAPSSKKIAMALKVLKKNYKGNADVDYNSDAKSFTISPTIDGFSTIIAEVQSGDTDDWDTLTQSIDQVSKTLYEDAGIKLPVSLVNPANKDKSLYTSIDGVGAYDFADEYR